MKPVSVRHLAAGPALAGLMLAGLSGCGALVKVGPDYAGPKQPVSTPSAWRVRWTPKAVADSAPGAGDRAASAAALRDWWQQFDDPLLAELIGAAQGASNTLAQAAARIAQSRSELTSAEARSLPTVDTSAALTRSAITFGGPVLLRTLAQVQAQAAWEIDLFGGIARSREGAVARVLARQAQFQDAQVALAAEVGNAYVGLRHCERLINLSEADARSRAETARLTELTGRAGLQAPAIVALARASAADAANQLLQQRAECDVLVKSLVVLTDRDEPALRVDLSKSTARLPVPRMFRVDQLPANVLRQRPDLAGLERELAAASADIGKAEAARYPALSLTGNVGPLRSSINGLTVNATTWSIGPSLTLPLFDGGRRVADVVAAKARYTAAESAYRERVRVAVREVEEALVRLASADAREQFAIDALDGYREALQGAQVRFDSGLGNLIDLELARREAVRAETVLSQLQRDRVSAWVSLYRAVGGGWTAEAASQGAATGTRGTGITGTSTPGTGASGTIAGATGR